LENLLKKRAKPKNLKLLSLRKKRKSKPLRRTKCHK